MNTATLYRRLTGSHSEDWGVIEYGGGAKVFFGKTGKAFRHRDIPQSQWKPSRSADLIGVKLDEGYRPVGRVGIDASEKIKPLSDGASAEVLSWEVVDRLSTEDLLAALSTIANAFETEAGFHSDVSLELEGMVLSFSSRDWKWEFGFSDRGGLLETSGRGAGQIDVVHDGPAPYLVLMKLNKMFPGQFQFCWSDGRACVGADLNVTHQHPFVVTCPFKWIWPIATELELVFNLDAGLGNSELDGWF